MPLDAANLALLRDTELVDLVPGTEPTPTWSWTRSQPVAGGTAADRSEDDPALADFREALGTLSSTTAPTLERHLAETLDAASHRLDAWITSLATRRLAEMREARPKGLRVGGYGWVENLRAATPGPAVTGIPDEPGPLVAPADDPGFIHAPSLNQASAAALLRNAHLSHGGEEDSPYAIELTSARVRLAKQLFEGVRQGQPIGALLGYTFERNLHDAQLDDLIDDFRALAPLPGASTPTGVRRLVVDGLALARKWQDRSRRRARARATRGTSGRGRCSTPWSPPSTQQPTPSTPRAPSRWCAATSPVRPRRSTRSPAGRRLRPTSASCVRRARAPA